MEQNNFDKQYRDALAGKLREKRSSGNMDEAQEMLAEQHGTMLYEGAKKAHQEGDQLETRNLSIEKKIAQLEALKEKINGAKENIDQAISIETPTEEDPVLAELRKDEKNIFGLLKEIAQEGKTNSPEWDAAQIAWRETVKKIEVHERENNPEVLQDKETAKAGFDKKNEDISEQETTLQSEANLNQTSEDGVVKAEEELRQDSKEQVVTQEDADKNVENQSKVDDVLENFDAIRADREREVMKSTLNASIDSAKKSLVWMTGKDPKNINDQLEAGKKIKNNRSWSTPSMVMREFRKLRQAEKQLKNLDQMFAGNEILEVNPTEAKEKGADRPYSEWSNEELQKAYSNSRKKEFIAGDQASGDHKRLNSLMAAALVERGLMSPLEAHESMEKPTAMAAMAAAELRNEDLKSKDENKKRFGGAWFKKNWKWLAGAGLHGQDAVRDSPAVARRGVVGTAAAAGYSHRGAAGAARFRLAGLKSGYRVPGAPTFSPAGYRVGV